MIMVALLVRGVTGFQPIANMMTMDTTEVNFVAQCPLTTPSGSAFVQEFGIPGDDEQHARTDDTKLDQRVDDIVASGTPGSMLQLKIGGVRISLWRFDSRSGGPIDHE